MISPDLDVAALLAPIHAAQPGGGDVAGSGDYERIGEARRDEKANLPRGVWVRDLKQADWPRVEALCTEALTRRGKDLRVACWLSEAWVHLHGLPGLAAALALLDGLCSDYWEVLYPPLDAGDAGARIAAIGWLNDRLPVALRLVPLMAPSTPSEPGYSWADTLAAIRFERVRREDMAAAAKAEAGGAVTMAMIERARERTDAAALLATRDAARAALDALAALDATLDARCGGEAPGLGGVRDVVADIADFASDALGMRETVEPATVAISSAPLQVAASRDAPMTRRAAYRQIAEIAEFLRAHDPHSPVSYILDQLCQWERMSLIEIDGSLQERGSHMSMVIAALGFGESDEAEI